MKKQGLTELSLQIFKNSAKTLWDVTLYRKESGYAYPIDSGIWDGEKLYNTQGALSPESYQIIEQELSTGIDNIQKEKLVDCGEEDGEIVISMKTRKQV